MMLCQLVKKPHVILVVGVNGVGKTTSIGKMANYYKSLGLKVMLELQILLEQQQSINWRYGLRVGVELVKQELGSDPASVS